MNAKKVAIACQGGGTHAAFTWGVLSKVLETQPKWNSETNGPAERFEITAFSGTSSGALCALAAWYGLVRNKADADCGNTYKAIERLRHLWSTFSAKTPTERSLNAVVLAAGELKGKGVPFPTTDPYSPAADVAVAGLSMLGARDEYLSFDSLLREICPDFDEINWEAVAESRLRMIAGAVEIHSGNFEVFDSHKTLEAEVPSSLRESGEQHAELKWRMRRPLSLEGVAASGTLPEVLRAQCIPNTEFPTGVRGTTRHRDAFYWDGLYSQNPPVRMLLKDVPKDEKPNEIWVIRINPQEMHGDVTCVEDIHDRANELAGNLSLNAELNHILSVNEWIDTLPGNHFLRTTRKHVVVRTIKMRRDTAQRLRSSTKADRSWHHLKDLHDEGRAVAEKWLADWRTQGQAFECYPNDASYPDGESVAPV